MHYTFYQSCKARVLKNSFQCHQLQLEPRNRLTFAQLSAPLAAIYCHKVLLLKRLSSSYPHTHNRATNKSHKSHYQTFAHCQQIPLWPTFKQNQRCEMQILPSNAATLWSFTIKILSTRVCTMRFIMLPSAAWRVHVEQTASLWSS